MRLPPSLSGDSESVAIEGMSGWRQGTFRAGPWSGEYRRSLDRLSIMNLFARASGTADFVLAGPGISSTIEAECDFRRPSITLGDASFTPRFAYGCDFFAEERPIPARFELQETRRGLANALTRDARRGEIGFAGEILQFRSEHRVSGGALPVEDPIGYVFEQDGEPVGAFELNGTPRIIFARGTDLDQRRAMVVASLALATVWDPDVVGDD